VVLPAGEAWGLHKKECHEEREAAAAAAACAATASLQSGRPRGGEPLGEEHELLVLG